MLFRWSKLHSSKLGNSLSFAYTKQDNPFRLQNRNYSGVTKSEGNLVSYTKSEDNKIDDTTPVFNKLIKEKINHYEKYTEKFTSLFMAKLLNRLYFSIKYSSSINEDVQKIIVIM